ncbi:MAG TPA: peptidoglycan recognition family protein, partial [Thermomicrobiales bacterium]|nr:peptidoglycan recognition family protein [Thermomicrobiales bacterium]
MNITGQQAAISGTLGSGTMCNCGTPRGTDLASIETKTAASALNRRVVLKAAAGLSAMAVAVAGGGGGQLARPAIAAAQEKGGTRATRWSPAPSIDAKAGENGDATDDGFRVFQTDYPFFALGASWSASVGLWPIVEVQVSADGETWSDSFQMMADTEDGGRPTREDRLFTPLIFTDATNWVRFRTIDSDGNAGSVDGLAFTYIDASDGPWEQDVADVGSPAPGDADTDVPPRLLSREAWGADESYRYDADGEIWPPSYELVHHIIIHHTDTPTYQDPLVAIRSIYYYHAVDQGWGDIGYNYLVDRNGTIYEGRYGGQNTVGGHSYQYAYGSSGICIIGDYQNQLESDAARAGLVQIVSWVGRDLDPYGAQDFLDVPNLPVICAHRDVNSTACPGDMLYGDLPAIRDLVAATLDSGSLDTGNPGGIAIRDRVIVQTDDGADL